ncbi:hypothetical protein NLG97_g9087 [Lecanicillium saksenae]|uniref:Uncharacterized protein n=1 Tax=Lecanicillium saksenae TaxID=468837 RepID=A0ACC1QKD2_9HYPO|nr:hypothetical protein NLG97_g9087 [Lecanicillium saksenae]
MWIKDLFYLHEHPRVINYVEFSIVLSPYLGPLIASFIVSEVVWRWAFWLCTILSGIGLVLVLFLDETLFDRRSPPASRGSRVSRLLGIQQAKDWKNRSLSECLARPLVALTKIPILLILAYYFLNFAWVIGVNTTIAIWLTSIYGFTTMGLGYFYFFGIVGVLLGWFAGHFLHDAVGRYYIQRHKGVLHPEARLIILYPATMLLCLSLVLLGLAFEYHWHYMAIAVFAAMQCLGVMIVTTAINAYLLDCYPEGSGEVSAWVTASRNWAGFMSTYIQIEWVERGGPARALGAQAGITLASVLFILALQVYGKRLRRWQGRMCDYLRPRCSACSTSSSDCDYEQQPIFVEFQPTSKKQRYRRIAEPDAAAVPETAALVQAAAAAAAAAAEPAVEPAAAAAGPAAVVAAGPTMRRCPAAGAAADGGRTAGASRTTRPGVRTGDVRRHAPMAS